LSHEVSHACLELDAPPQLLRLRAAFLRQPVIHRPYHTRDIQPLLGAVPIALGVANDKHGLARSGGREQAKEEHKIAVGFVRWLLERTREAKETGLAFGAHSERVLSANLTHT